jgi:hypothetical protein
MGWGDGSWGEMVWGLGVPMVPALTKTGWAVLAVAILGVTLHALRRATKSGVRS